MSTGADGVIRTWDVADGHLDDTRQGAPIKLASPYGPLAKVPAVRALAVSPQDEDIIVGTGACDVLEVNAHQQVWSCSCCCF